MNMVGPVGPVVAGPLARHEARFRAYLACLGYAPRSVRSLVRVMGRASFWLEERGLTASGLTSAVAADLEAGLAGMGPVLRFLREAGEVPAADSGVGAAPVEALLAQFRGWLAGERGLSAATVACYGKQARKFLAQLGEPLDAALLGLDAGQVTSFMLGYCQGRNRESAKALVTAMRALLRFLHVAGYVPVPLAAAVPAVAGWRLSSLPRGLDAAVVERLLGSCDRATVTGRRDYAILVLLARLGLRGAEVAALELADVDWRGGEVAICGKGSRMERLPLPAEVGEAVAEYLMAGRPRCDAATVFCTARAPYRRLSPAAIRGIMGQACRRAGLKRVGAHRLRHSLATEMLRAGASLPEVGQVLRHRSQLSTSVYAKVDENALRVLARPWPGGGS
jgi:site-specific recombinase XerD